MSSSKVRLTVGLPVYNGERYIAGALNTMLSQTYQDLELVISDNASTDLTEDICREYAARDRRVVYLRNPENRGAAWNHNRLVETARGSLFKWMAADDLYQPSFLTRCVTELDRDPSATLAYPRSVAIDECENRLYEYSPGWELRSDSSYERLRAVILKGGHWINADAVSGVIRIGALRNTRMLPTYLGGDKRPLGELSLLGKFIEVPEYLLLRRFHPDSSGWNNPHTSGYDRRSVQWTKDFHKGSTLTSYLPSWALMGDHMITIWSSSLPLIQKVRLTSTIARACYWHNRFFGQELKNLPRLGSLIISPRATTVRRTQR